MKASRSGFFRMDSSPEGIKAQAEFDESCRALDESLRLALLEIEVACYLKKHGATMLMPGTEWHLAGQNDPAVTPAPVEPCPPPRPINVQASTTGIFGWPLSKSNIEKLEAAARSDNAFDRIPNVLELIEIEGNLMALGLHGPNDEHEPKARIDAASPLPAPIAAPAPIEAPAARAATKPAKPRRKATRPKRINPEQLARQRKRAVLVAELEAQWPSIEADLNEGGNNGLQAAARVKHGIWDKAAAVAWAQSRGKWRTEAEIISHPASVWSGLGAKHKRA